MIHDDAFILPGALGNDCPDAVFGSIAFNKEGFVRVRCRQNWCRDQGRFECIKRFLFLWTHTHFMSDPVSVVSGAATDENE